MTQIEESESARQAAALSIRDVDKTFGPVAALTGVSFDVAPGTIHALVGANGAGKSTMLGILAGRIPATSGDVQLFGQSVRFDNPRAARKAGICAIYQELSIVPALSARANVFLGQETRRYGVLQEAEMEQTYRSLCRRMQVEIPGGVLARSLSVADQQALEIMRGLQSHARVLLFDEPTAALAAAERDSLFRTMRELREGRTTMILVSHNLDEVLEMSDIVTVFRDGRMVETAPRQQWTKARLVRAMVGRDVGDLRSGASNEDRRGASQPVLSVRDVSIPGVLEDISLELHEGEIVGIGGLVGSGRTTFLRSLVGLESETRGQLEIDGVRVAWPKTPRQALKYGIGLAPEDRKGQGLVPSLSALENLTLANLGRATRSGLIFGSIQKRLARPVAEAYGFDPERLDAEVRTLSGGNQQKVLLARWGYHVPRVLLIDEPTRGIDVGAKEEILNTIQGLARQGLAILVVSSELEEVVAISHRVIVFANGCNVVELASGPDLDVDTILHASFGLSSVE